MMLLLEIAATFCAGVFFGAAVYISIAQHPAVLEAGAHVGKRFFGPMYRRAAPMQIVLAVGGSLAGIARWSMGNGLMWIVGSLCLLSVIPITLVVIKPINDVLLNADSTPHESDTGALLKKWGPKHGWRSIVSGVAFVLFLLARGAGCTVAADVATLTVVEGGRPGRASERRRWRLRPGSRGASLPVHA